MTMEEFEKVINKYDKIMFCGGQSEQSFIQSLLTF